VNNRAFQVLSIATICLLSVSETAFAAIAEQPTFARDSNGNAVAVWIDLTASTISINANTYVDGSWGIPQNITSGGINTQLPVLGVSAVGSDDISAIVIWADNDSSSNTTLYSSMLPSASGSWTAVNEITKGVDETVSTNYSVQVSNDGTALIVYTLYNTSTFQKQINVITTIIDSSNTLGSPTVISE